MKKLIALVLACLMLFSLCSCNRIKEMKRGKHIHIDYTQDGIDEFYTDLLGALEDKTTEISKIQMNFEINKKDIYNITPENSEEKTGYKVFKDISNNCAFLYSEAEIVPLYASLSDTLGIFSDYSIYTISLTDINKDGAYEYIYSYVYATSLSSIVPKRGIEIFDLATKKHSNLVLTDDWKTAVVTYSTNDEFCHIYSVETVGDETGGKLIFQEKLGEVRYTPGKGFYYEEKAEK